MSEPETIGDSRLDELIRIVLHGFEPFGPEGDAIAEALRDYKRLRAEVEKLREVLQDIVDERRTDEDGIYHRLACTADMVEHASTALRRAP